MKKIVVAFFFLFLAVNSSANSNVLPDEVFIREHWVSLTKSYDIETKTQKLGTLYRRFFSLLLTYDFYDPQEVKTATAKAKFFSFGAHLDIYDQNDAFIGNVEEKIFNFLPTFEILAPDASTKLARAEMNFWGTKFYIYDPASNQEMAIMSRPFFRLKNNWTIRVTNRALLDQKNIDSRVLMTVLAVQGEIEDWQKDHGSDHSLTDAKQSQLNQYNELTQQIKACSIKEGLDTLEKPNQESLEALADELDQQFHASHPIEDQNQSNEEQIKTFTTYCLNLVHSQDLSVSKKKAILTLLNLRLEGHI